MENQEAPSNKKLYIAVGVLVVLVIIAAISFFMIQRPSSKSAVPTPDQVLNDPSQSNKTIRNPNPFIAPDDLDAVDEAFADEMRKNGKLPPQKPTYNFEYELAPELMNKPQTKDSFFNIFSQVFAAEPPATCDTTTIPATVPVYDLRAHWTAAEASIVAREFNLDGNPYSREDQAGSFDYYFTKDFETGFLKLNANSGVYTFHQVPESTGAAISVADRNANAQLALETHHLGTTIAEPVQTESSVSLYRYIKSWGNYPVIDRTSLDQAGAGRICDIPSAVDVNYIENYLAADGVQLRFINKSRTQTRVREIQTQSLEDSFTDYSDNPPIEPIVIPPTATSGKVTFDESTIVYYDYGVYYPQTNYIPVYLLRGSVEGSSAKVYAMYPVISRSVLEQLNILKAPSSTQTMMDDSGMKQAALGIDPVDVTGLPEPPPPKSAVPTNLTPTLPGNTPAYGGGGGKFGGGGALDRCPLGAVDYDVRCTSGGRVVCTDFIEVEEALTNASPDPVDVCKNGCKSITKVVTISGGANPCKKMLELNNIPSKSHMDLFNSGKSFTDGDVSCTIDACPC